MLIEDADLVIVDLETTGIDPANERMIELAAVRICGDRVVDTFESLIDPERSIPKVITRITGIISADVDGAPRAYDVLPDFIEFLGEAVFVAHNCSFDWNFIKSELQRAHLPELTNSKLCTVRLARRLLPGLPSRSLGSLINFYNIQTNSRHRALSDVRSTHEVLMHLIDRLKRQHEITELDQLLRFQNSRYEKKSIQKNLSKVEACITKIPNVSGVYKMFGKGRRLLYIGKAKVLSSRVRSYFNGVEGHAKHIRQMIRQVHDIKWIVTPTELEALLLESRLIKEFVPPFNKAGRTYQHKPFIRLGVIGSSMWATVIEHVRLDGAQYFGPMPSRKEAIQLTQALVHLFGDASYSFRSFEQDGVGLTSSKIGGRLANDGLQNAMALLQGTDVEALTTLMDEIEEASQSQDYEVAAQKRDFLNTLQSIGLRPHFLKTPLLDRTGAVVYQCKQETEIHFMISGVPVSHLKWTGDQEILEQTKSSFYDDARQTSDRLSAQQVDAMSVFGAWMFKEKDHISVVSLSKDEAPAQFDAKLHAFLRNEQKIKKK